MNRPSRVNKRVKLMIAIIVFFISAFGMGCFVLSKMKLCVEYVPERAVVSTAIGLGLWCYILFVMGHFGLFYKWALLSGAVATAPLGVFYGINAIREYRQKKHNFNFSRFDIFLFALVGCILILTLTSCFCPVYGGIQNDEIATHLSVPNDWLIHHKICILPYPVSYLAGHVELLFLWIMAFTPAYGPKLFSWICYFLCALLVVIFAKQAEQDNSATVIKNKMSGRAAILAGVFVAINPLIFREAFLAFVDLPAALFNFLAFWSIFKYYNTKNIKHLLLCAFFMGVGCGAKPSNYFYIPAFVVLLSIVIFKLQSFGPGLKKLCMTIILILIFASPWPVRNMILSNSPTFPPPLALYTINHDKPFVFSGKPFTRNNAQDIYNYYHSRICKHGTGIKNFFLLPWNFTMYPESFSIGDSVGSIMLSFLPFVFFMKKRPVWLNAALIYCCIAVACIYFCIIPEARYFIPAYLVACPVAAWVIENLLRRKSIAWAVKAAIILNIIFSCAIAARICLPEARAAIDKNYRESFCAANTPYYETFNYLNAKKPEKLFVMYGNQVLYYLKTPYITGENALDTIKPMHGACLLDIDYSQNEARDFKKMTGAYCVKNPPDFLKLVFSGPDARVYAVR